MPDIKLTEAEYQRLQAVVEAAQHAYTQSLYTRSHGHGSIVKTDLAMTQLRGALDALGEITPRKVGRRKRKAS